MQKPIERTLTISISLVEAATMLGYGPKRRTKNASSHNDWTSTNEYLDADSHDDVWHDGYTTEAIFNMNPSLPDGKEGADKLFPEAVARALEDAERDAIASHIGETRREAIVENLEKINVTGEYQSSEGEMISVRGCTVTDVSVDVPSASVSITIVNPEHLINDLVNGVGLLTPPFDPYEAADDEEIKKAFVANAGEYFDVYGESIRYSVDSRYQPSVKDEHMKDFLEERIAELTLSEVVDAVVDAVDDGRYDSDSEAIEAAVRICPVVCESKAKLAKNVADFLNQRQDHLSEKTAARVQELSSL